MTGRKAKGNDKDIAIIGMSALFAGARNLREFWHNILTGKDCISDVPESRWRSADYYDPDPMAPDKSYCRRGGFLPEVEFNPLEFGLPPNILEVTDTSQLLSLVMAREAFKDAGLLQNGAFTPELRARTGVILGAGVGQKLLTPLTARLQYPVWEKVLRSSGLSEDRVAQLVDALKKAYIRWDENSFPGMLGNVISGRIANHFDLRGINCVIDAACAASLSALELAVMELQSNRCDMVLTGGVDTDNSPFMYLSFSKTPAFSPSGHIRPFADNADGMLIGEGIGFLVCRRLADAVRDKNRIYAVIRGIGSSSDGKSGGVYAPNPRGQMLAIRRAYEAAGADPSSVGLLEAHGTGTVAGDPAEFNSMNDVFRSGKKGQRPIAVGSVKSQIGHTKAAAGAAGLIKAALGIYHQVLPPTINVNNPNPLFTSEQSSLFVNTFSRPWFAGVDDPPRRAGVSAFGFGGINFHVALEEWQGTGGERQRVDQLHSTLMLSALDLAQLADSAKDRLEQLQSPEAEKFFSQWANHSVGMVPPETHPRLAIVAATADEAGKALSVALDRLKNHEPETEWRDPDQGIFFCSQARPATDKIVALFPGQGSQYLYMGRMLACVFPEIRRPFISLDQKLKNITGEWLSDIVYPVPAFGAPARQQQEQRINQTCWAQPALAGLSVGMYNLLQQLGLKADFTAGHSFGELTALWAAHVLSEDDYFQLTISRGQAMMPPPQTPDFDPGMMLAVKGNRDDVLKIVIDIADVQPANVNSPIQVVLAGSTPGIRAAKERLQARSYSVAVLPVSAAFHSHRMRHAQANFAQAIEAHRFHQPDLPVFSNATGRRYPSNVSQVKDMLREHMLKPVQFVDEIEQIYSAAGRIFVEIGPRGILTRLTGEILGKRDHLAVALNPDPRKDDLLQLLQAVAWLRVQGVPLKNPYPDLRWQEDHVSPSRDKLIIRLSGNNYVSDKTRFSFEQALARLQTPPPAPGSNFSENNADAILRQLAALRGEVDELKTMMGQKSLSSGKNAAPPPVEKSIPVFQQEEDKSASLPIADELRSIIAAKTGYPADVLDMDMDLERDLGIDSIKRVEILGALQNRFPHLGQIGTQMLGEWRTLGQVAAFLQENEPAAPSRSAKNPYQPDARADILFLLSEKTGYPVDVLELDMDLERDLGIDSIKRVEILGALQGRFPAISQISPASWGEWRTLRQVIDYIEQQTVTPEPQKEQQSPDHLAGEPSSLAWEKQEIVAVVAEKTGYPVDVLELDMDLERDLGIDSIKRVEILGVLQNRFPWLASLSPVDLNGVRSLRQIIDLAEKHNVQPENERQKTQQPRNEKSAPSLLRLEPVLLKLPALTSRPLTMPPDVVALISGCDLDWMENLAQQLANEQIRPVLVMLNSNQRSGGNSLPGKFPLYELTEPEDQMVIDLLATIRHDHGPMGMVVHIHPRLKLNGSDPLQHYPQEERLMSLVFILARHLHDYLHALPPAHPAHFIVMSRLDGQLGLSGNPKYSVMGAGLAGLVKTARLEWPQIRCRWIDLDPDLDARTGIQRALTEISADAPLVTEIGLSRDERFTIVSEEKIQSGKGQLRSWGKDSLFLISGGGRGITAACVSRLAQEAPCQFILLGRSAVRAEMIAGVDRNLTDKEIRRRLLEKQQQQGDKKSLPEIEKQLQDWKASQEILSTITNIEQAGGQVRYIQADITRPGPWQEKVRQVLQDWGPVTGIIHGAGVIRDRWLVQKNTADFSDVFSAKIGGLRQLLLLTDPGKLRHLVLFSSAAAVAGNPGQADYALANEVLNKIAHQFKNLYPQCRVLAIDWGPWSGGMVTPQLAQHFQERGVPLISLQIGPELFLQELRAPESAAAQVIIGGLPVGRAETGGAPLLNPN